MLVVDLACARGHTFEGWFASAEDLSTQQARGLLVCPVCSDRQVERRPSVPRLNVSGATSRTASDEPGGAKAPRQGQASEEAPCPAPPADQLAALQAAWLLAAREVMRRTEDVGQRFAEEARRIHHGEAPERAIRGQATAAQAQELQDEGIEIAALPLPDVLKQTMQ